MDAEKSCGAVVFRIHKGRVEYLLIQNRHGENWDFSKGHVEPGESEEETAVREVLEETGIGIKILPGFRYEVRYVPKPNIQKTVVFFAGQTMGGELKSQDAEIKSIGWFLPEHVEKKLTFENSKELYRNARKFIQKHYASA